MKAIQFEEFGDPAEVLKVVEIEEPGEPGPDQVLVQVTYSPVNLHDVYLVSGYLAKPPLPAVAGNEGIGRVLGVGGGVTNVAAGDLVVLPLLSGAWRARLTVPAAGLFPLPEADQEQLSMLGSNSPTAGLILSEFGQLRAGDWVAQSAANGGVGLNLVVLAKQRGFRTINLVRSEAAVAEVEAAGGDIVLVDHTGAVSEIRARIGADARVPLAADSVGGAAGATLIDLLDDGGSFVSYNASSGQPIDPAGDAVTAKHVTVSGFFVGAFDDETKIVPVIREVAPLIADRTLTVPVAAVYSLDDITDAIAHVQHGGKVLLRVDEDA